MKIKFENNLTYQQEAIEAVVDIFKGQEKLVSNFTVLSPTMDKEGGYRIQQEESGYANKLSILPKQMVENVQEIQMRNGLKISHPDEIDRKDLHFTIEMETGTGKTYVFTRSILEMHQKYGFKKFIVVVPSVSIREGINKSLELTDEHFRKEFQNIPYKYFIYDSANLSQVRDFATSDQIRIMIINIQAFARDMDNTLKSNKRILLDYNDKLGAIPINLIQKTNPIVIIDEPQSTVSSPLQKKSVQNLNPLVTYRFSATHKEKINLLYKFDAIDAYNDGKVKKIEVASVTTIDEASDGAYIQLVSVSNRGGFKAKMVLDVKGRNGKVKRTSQDVKHGDDLYEITKLDQYFGYFVREISVDPEFVDFNNGHRIKTGETLGGINDREIKRKLIAKTIEEHLDKEVTLNPKGIKVLSLFFIDAVAKYRQYDDEGNHTNGDYAQIFEEEYQRLISYPKYQTLFKEVLELDADVADVHKGYFSSDRKAKASDKKERFEYFRDTTGNIKADEDTYQLIMKDKERLLGFDNKVRFLFSHSALKEGWDNPNVFQICLLKEMGASEIRRRQEIGRGLRISVDQTGNRVYDESVNILTTVVNESFTAFVEGYQKELSEDTGIKFGYLEMHSFNTVVCEIDENDQPVYLGQTESEKLYRHFIKEKYIDKKGKIQDSLKIDFEKGTLDLGQEFDKNTTKQILNIIKQVAGSLEIKDTNDKKNINVNKQVYLSDDFKQLWDSIKYKTIYKVDFDSEKLIRKCIESINNNILNQKSKVEIVTGKLRVGRDGIGADGDVKTYVEHINAEVMHVPDIVSYLQNETDLTRKTIVRILKGLEKRVIGYFKINPQAFIEGCIDMINLQKRLFIVDGIKYHKIGEDVYYDQKLIEEKELIGYLSNRMVEATKSAYNYTMCDSEVEVQLAREFENSDNISLYTKLPNWFKVPTPLGSYNPDWAILYNKEGNEKLFFVTESKGSMFAEDLRPIEQGKIDCGRKHFKSIDSRMIVASSMADVNRQV